MLCFIKYCCYYVGSDIYSAYVFILYYHVSMEQVLAINKIRIYKLKYWEEISHIFAVQLSCVHFSVASLFN
jgi:hypothetical protein